MTRTILASDFHRGYKSFYMPSNNNMLGSSNSHLNTLDHCLALWAGAKGIAAKALPGLLTQLDSLLNSRKCNQPSLSLAC